MAGERKRRRRSVTRLSGGPRTSQTSLTLHALLEPITTEEFIDKYWQRQYLVLPTRRQTELLLTLRDVEFLIASVSNPTDAIIVHPNLPVPRQINNLLTLSQAHRAFLGGRTVLLTMLERRWKKTAALCSSIDRTLREMHVPQRRSVGANAYLTPPNSCAFPAHFDDHDVFVLQVEGEKEWSIFKPTDELPEGKLTHVVTPDELPPVDTKLTLRAGGLLYIPRGVYHVAHTSNSYSLHITISVFPMTWAEAVVQAAGTSPSLREALPGELETVSPGEVASRLDQLRSALSPDVPD